MFLQLSESKDEQVCNSFVEVKTGAKWSASSAGAEVSQRIYYKQVIGSLTSGKMGLGYGKKYSNCSDGRKKIIDEIKLGADESFYLKAVSQPLQG